MTPLRKEFYDKGRSADCPVLDTHAHMYPLGQAHLPRSSPEAMLGTMDRRGVALALFSSHRALYSPSVGVAEDIAAVRRWPNRFRAYYTVAVRNVSPADVFRGFEAHPDVFVGFKFHPEDHRVPIDSPAYAPYLEYADEHKLVCLCHTWNHPMNAPSNVSRALSRWRRLVFIAGHAFQGCADEGARMAADHPNIYLELTSIGAYRGMIEILARHTGTGRILFGTDLPWFDTIIGMGGVLSADLSDDGARDILYRNAASILSRFAWFPPLWEEHLAGRGLTAETLP